MDQRDKQSTSFIPLITADQNIPEVTWRAIILGSIISALFGVANAYIGLKFGMTVSASIPAAVISMAVLRSLFKRVTVLENNIVQTIGSAGESLAAGVVLQYLLSLFGRPTQSWLPRVIITKFPKCRFSGCRCLEDLLAFYS